jgi:ribosomal 50S subunit-associated protein YjgA (DUF615 family)
MTNQNYGNRHVSAEQWNIIGLAFGTLQQELRDALSVTTGEQRQRAVRMGDGSVAFVEKSIEVAKQNQDLLRRGFDLDELQRDFESRKRLHALELQLTQMLEQVRNAVVAHGSDAMAGALEIYGAVQDDEGEGADALRKLLGKRFVRSATKDVPEPGKA